MSDGAPTVSLAPTIGEALDLLAERDPAAPAVDDGAVRLTRGELRDASRRLARLLIGRGVRQGDLVCLRGANTAAFVVAACAIWRAGGTPQPLSPRLPLDEQHAVVALADPRLVLGADPAEFPGRTVLPIDPAAESYSDGPLPPLAAPSWKAPTSSGSTGRPKLVLASAPARVDPDRQVAPFLPLAARQLVVGPLTHSAPFTYAMRGLTTGHALVLLPRFEAQAVLDAIGAHRITWVLLVPTMLHRILRLPPEQIAEADLSSLQHVVHIGAPIDPALKRRWLDLLGAERLTEVYAGSESNGLTVIRGDEWLQHPGSVGRPASGTEVRVVRPDGSLADVGEIGRVQLRRTAGAAYRYLGAPTPAAGEWDSLGDDGSLDAEGYLYLTDRGGDRITRAGTSLYPVEVERVLEAHPAVRSAVAVGVPDDDLGTRIHAVADIDDAEIDSDRLLAWAHARLHPEKRPDTLQLVREPLRDDAGKVRRSAWR
ncbi:AMP-binding protein [uncultured Amnibacterium sp.]|uniref:AMP-binding protein n=1 Tax=uncultured Amnibacterium sp. TaxID=1631851 RepID=UPI0035C9D671